MKHYLHSGSCGDLIYGLPVIRQLGAGILHIWHEDGFGFERLSPQLINSLTPLLKQQPYIYDVVTDKPVVDFNNLNKFRKQPNLYYENLAYNHAYSQNLPKTITHVKWINCTPIQHGRVVINRTERYRNDKFPWKKFMQEYGNFTMFIGSKKEHELFSAEFGDIDYTPTKDFLEVAQIISGSKLFIGNQSCCAAIAEGLKHNMVLEVCPSIPNCIFERANRINWNQ